MMKGQDSDMAQSKVVGIRTADGTAKAGKRPSRFSNRKVDRAFYWMAVPAALIFTLFLYVPFLQGVAYSFTNSQGYGRFSWIGFKNYGALFRDGRVGHAYLFTLLIAILITLLVNFIALFISVALNGKIAFKNGFRVIYFIPYTLSVLVIGYVFKYIFMTPLPALGKALGISWLSQSLLTSEHYAWIPIVFLSVWQAVAYSTLIYLAGLQTIDSEVYEAASIDGANEWQKFWRITFPLDWPILHHQPCADSEECLQHLRPGGGSDRRRARFQDRNSHLPHLQGRPYRRRVRLPDSQRGHVLHRPGCDRIHPAGHFQKRGEDLRWHRQRLCNRRHRHNQQKEGEGGIGDPRDRTSRGSTGG